MHLDFQEVNQKYGMLVPINYALFVLIDSGSLARVGPNDLVTSDPAVMKRMLAVRSPYRRSEWYIGIRFDPVRDNIASTRDEDRHTELRAMMAAGVSQIQSSQLLQNFDTPCSTQAKRTRILKGQSTGIYKL
jgi:hypothetical protein